MARADGRVIFVRHALPGERVRIEVTERKKRYWRADAVEVLEASPDRVEAPCRFAGACGGCDFQHASHAAQLDLKTTVLREQLTRLGGLSEAEASRGRVEALPGGALGWRTRVQYAVGSDGRPGLRAHRSREVVHVDECVVADPAIRGADVLRRRWRGSNEVGVTSGPDGEASVYTKRDRRGRKRMVSGDADVVRRVAGRDFRVAADGFWQVHRDAAETFSACVRAMAAPRGGETVWDLYAGAGVFAAAAAEAVGTSGRVVAVELDGAATADNLADLPHVEVRSGDVSALLGGMPSPDVVILDPPRAGAGAGVVDSIASAAPRAIVYVACDPAALARDLRTFAAAGFGLEDLRAFDAFPMTHHFETVALLSRG
ncbi:MAG: class I SAM-dependent RNA methyltransferase [Stackebrandtia sp.]